MRKLFLRKMDTQQFGNELGQVEESIYDDLPDKLNGSGVKTNEVKNKGKNDVEET